MNEDQKLNEQELTEQEIKKQELNKQEYKNLNAQRIQKKPGILSGIYALFLPSVFIKMWQG